MGLQKINYAVYVTVKLKGKEDKKDWSHFRTETRKEAERKARRFFSIAYSVKESQILINKNR